MLDCIHEDIKQHSVALVRVKVYRGYVSVCFQDYVDVFCVFLGNDVLDALLDPSVEVNGLDFKTVFANLHLSQVENHVQKFSHPA